MAKRKNKSSFIHNHPKLTLVASVFLLAVLVVPVVRAASGLGNFNLQIEGSLSELAALLRNEPVQTEEKLGAVVSREAVLSDCDSSVVGFCVTQKDFATSSVVSIINPLNATATLITVGVNITDNSIGLAGAAAAETFDLARSGNKNATTSASRNLLRKQTLLAANTDTVVWHPGLNATTTANFSNLFSQDCHDNVDCTGESSVIFGPTDYLVLKFATGTPQNAGKANDLQGRLRAVWLAL